MTGHLLGGAGGIEAVITALAIKNQIAPPTINIDDQDIEAGCDLDYNKEGARPMNIRVAISNSFGFGGTNGTVVLKRVDWCLSVDLRRPVILQAALLFLLQRFGK